MMGSADDTLFCPSFGVQDESCDVDESNMASSLDSAIKVFSSSSQFIGVGVDKLPKTINSKPSTFSESDESEFDGFDAHENEVPISCCSFNPKFGYIDDIVGRHAAIAAPPLKRRNFAVRSGPLAINNKVTTEKLANNVSTKNSISCTDSTRSRACSSSNDNIFCNIAKLKTTSNVTSSVEYGVSQRARRRVSVPSNSYSHILKHGLCINSPGDSLSKSLSIFLRGSFDLQCSTSKTNSISAPKRRTKSPPPSARDSIVMPSQPLEKKQNVNGFGNISTPPWYFPQPGESLLEWMTRGRQILPSKSAKRMRHLEYGFLNSISNDSSDDDDHTSVVEEPEVEHHVTRCKKMENSEAIIESPNISKASTPAPSTRRKMPILKKKPVNAESSHQMTVLDSRKSSDVKLLPNRKDTDIFEKPISTEPISTNVNAKRAIHLQSKASMWTRSSPAVVANVDCDKGRKGQDPLNLLIDADATKTTTGPKCSNNEILSKESFAQYFVMYHEKIKNPCAPELQRVLRCLEDDVEQPQFGVDKDTALLNADIMNGPKVDPCLKSARVSEKKCIEKAMHSISSSSCTVALTPLDLPCSSKATVGMAVGAVSAPPKTVGMWLPLKKKSTTSDIIPSPKNTNSPRGTWLPMKRLISVGYCKGCQNEFDMSNMTPRFVSIPLCVDCQKPYHDWLEKPWLFVRSMKCALGGCCEKSPRICEPCWFWHCVNLGKHSSSHSRELSDDEFATADMLLIDDPPMDTSYDDQVELARFHSSTRTGPRVKHVSRHANVAGLPIATRADRRNGSGSMTKKVFRNGLDTDDTDSDDNSDEEPIAILPKLSCLPDRLKSRIVERAKLSYVNDEDERAIRLREIRNGARNSGVQQELDSQIASTRFRELQLDMEQCQSVSSSKLLDKSGVFLVPKTINYGKSQKLTPKSRTLSPNCFPVLESGHSNLSTGDVQLPEKVVDIVPKEQRRVNVAEIKLSVRYLLFELLNRVCEMVPLEPPSNDLKEIVPETCPLTRTSYVDRNTPNTSKSDTSGSCFNTSSFGLDESDGSDVDEGDMVQSVGIPTEVADVTTTCSNDVESDSDDDAMISKVETECNIFDNIKNLSQNEIETKPQVITIDDEITIDDDDDCFSVNSLVSF